MLPENPLHLMIHAPPLWQVLGLKSINEMLPPHPDEVLQRCIAIFFTGRHDSFDDFLTVWVHLLLIAQFQWLELAPKAELNQLKDLVVVLFKPLHKVFWYDLLDIVFLLHHDAVRGAFLHHSNKFISFL